MSCPKHPDVKQICPACIGEHKSVAKSAASKRNGKLGGRPKKGEEMNIERTDSKIMRILKAGQCLAEIQPPFSAPGSDGTIPEVETVLLAHTLDVPDTLEIPDSYLYVKDTKQ
jgi:hypothetical protein